MNDDIIRMAREAGFDAHDMSADFTCNLKDIERFAELVRAEERKTKANPLGIGEMELLLRRNHKDGLFECRRHFCVEEVTDRPAWLVEVNARLLDAKIDFAIRARDDA